MYFTALRAILHTGGEKKEKTVKFAVIGDCHYSEKGNYAQRDCLGANKRLSEIIDIVNNKRLDFVFSMSDLGDGHSKRRSRNRFMEGKK